MLHPQFTAVRPSRTTLPHGTISASKKASIRHVLDGVASAPTTVTEAYDTLTLVSARLRDIGDSRAVFPDIYAVVTRRVRDAIHGPARPLFVEPAFISRLAGRFCELYLAALRRSLEGEHDRIAAWAVADRVKGSPRALPAQHAILGLNAHINFDLALGLFANVLALGGAGDERTMARYLHDHDAVNEILAEALPEVIGLLADRYGCPASRLLLQLHVDEGRSRTFALILFTLTRWRTRVWSDLLDLLAAPGPVERLHVEARMNRRAHLLARLFAVPAPVRASGAMTPLPAAA